MKPTILSIFLGLLSLFSKLTYGSRLVELGAIIRNATDSAFIDAKTRAVYDNRNGIRLMSNYITVDTNRNKQSLTTAIFNNKQQPSLTARGCVPTYFSTTLIKIQLNNLQYTMFLIDDGASINLGNLNNEKINSLDQFAGNKVIVASFSDSPLSDDVERQLVDKYDAVVISNLIRPRNKQLLDTAKSYWAYLLIFDLFRSDDTTRRLANVVLAEKGDNFLLCSSNKGEGRHLEVLSHDFWGDNPIFPGYDKPAKKDHQITFLDHLGTHLDTPYHLLSSGLSSEKLPVDALVPCLKVQQLVTNDDDNHLVDRSAFLDWERQAGRQIPERSLVLVDTGYHKLWRSPSNYSNFNTQTGGVAFPGFDPNALNWLIQNRHVLAIGIDTLSTDAGNSTDLLSHIVLAKNGVLGVENVGNLDWFPDAKGQRAAIVTARPHQHAVNPIGQCLLVYLRSERGTGAPCAIFAHIERDYTASANKSGEQAAKRNLFSSTYLTITIVCLALLSFF